MRSKLHYSHKDHLIEPFACELAKSKILLDDAVPSMCHFPEFQSKKYLNESCHLFVCSSRVLVEAECLITSYGKSSEIYLLEKSVYLGILSYPSTLLVYELSSTILLAHMQLAVLFLEFARHRHLRFPRLLTREEMRNSQLTQL